MRFEPPTLKKYPCFILPNRQTPAPGFVLALMVLALSQAVGPRRRASAPRRRKKILAAMLWCLLNGYDDDDDAYLFQNAYQSYQEEENASLLRVVSLVELYERARRDKRTIKIAVQLALNLGPIALQKCPRPVLPNPSLPRGAWPC